jgi:hypothetical protein
MSTGIKALIGVAIGIGAVIVVGIIAAIAIPVFLNQRGKAVSAHTVVSIPPTAAGLPLRTDAASERLAQQLTVSAMPGEHLVGAYGGTTSPAALVTITKWFMSSQDQREYLAGAVRGAQSTGRAAPFHDASAGSLGGVVRCSAAATVTVCFFADAAAYGTLVVSGTPEHAGRLVPQLRAALERRS